MNVEEFNHLQNQINDAKSRMSQIEHSNDAFKPKSCPCERAENGNCQKCVSDDISQKTRP